MPCDLTLLNPELISILDTCPIQFREQVELALAAFARSLTGDDAENHARIESEAKRLAFDATVKSLRESWGIEELSTTKARNRIAYLRRKAVIASVVTPTPDEPISQSEHDKFNDFAVRYDGWLHGVDQIAFTAPDGQSCAGKYQSCPTRPLGYGDNSDDDRDERIDAGPAKYHAKPVSVGLKIANKVGRKVLTTKLLCPAHGPQVVVSRGGRFKLACGCWRTKASW